MERKEADVDLDPYQRWLRLGPYYAMFPVEFALETVEKYTQPGDWVLDPFCGRGTSVAAAEALNRQGVGVEINPVGWLYGAVKIAPVSEQKLLSRLREFTRIKPSIKNKATQA